MVTGAASGIGFGLANKFCAEGMKVVLADINEDNLEVAVADLQERGYHATGILTDVSNQADVRDLAEQALARFGAVHILCNNAAIRGTNDELWACSDSDWNSVMGANLWSVVWGIRSFIPIMLAQESEGYIVNTASMSALLTARHLYGVAKAGVIAISEAIYSQLRAMDAPIGVCCLVPGYTLTALGAAQPEHSQRPSLVAEKVVDCIRKDRFWVMPNEFYRPLAVDRVESAFDGRNPTLLSELLRDGVDKGW